MLFLVPDIIAAFTGLLFYLSLRIFADGIIDEAIAPCSPD
jgi:hypothetical protein